MCEIRVFGYVGKLLSPKETAPRSTLCQYRFSASLTHFCCQITVFTHAYVLTMAWGGTGGTPGDSCGGGGGAARFCKSWSFFRPQNVIFHTRFQTWPLKSRPVVSPGITINDVIVSQSANRKISWNLLRISHITVFFLFIWNWTDKYIHTLL